jgi:arylamine N-acetyltransferase
MGEATAGTGGQDHPGFDLDAYLQRIGHPPVPVPDLSRLRSLVACHTRTIAFENLDPFLGRPVMLDPASLQAKLVAGRRGGYCFEQNLLLSHALATIGYATEGLAARVVWHRPEDLPLPPRSHMLVRVELDEGPHLVDVGFGGVTLTGVLRLEAGTVQQTPHEPFRLVEVGDGGLIVQAEVAGTWQSLYRFGLEPAVQSDYEVSSWYLSNHPESPFVTGLTAARAGEGRRYALRGHELTVHHLGTQSRRRTLGSPAELVSALEGDFGLDLSGLGDIEGALARLWEPGETTADGAASR